MVFIMCCAVINRTMQALTTHVNVSSRGEKNGPIPLQQVQQERYVSDRSVQVLLETLIIVFYVLIYYFI
jgi:hypothetical protein